MYSFFQKWNIKELRWALLYYSNLFTNIACLDGIGCENTWETECLSLTHNNDWEEEHEEKSLSVTLARVRNLHLEKRSNRIHRYVIKVLFQSSILLHRLQEKNLSFLIFMFFYLKNYLREFVRLGELFLYLSSSRRRGSTTINHEIPTCTGMTKFHNIIICHWSLQEWHKRVLSLHFS